MPHFVLVSKKIQVYWQQMRPGSHRGFWLAPHKSFSYLLTYVRNIPVHYLHNYINARQTSPYANKSVAPVPHARTSQSGRQLSIIDLFFFRTATTIDCARFNQPRVLAQYTHQSGILETISDPVRGN